MKPKIVSFKFTKKHPETKEKTIKSKKNYENIFNDILSGTKPEKHLKSYTKREQNSSIATKKNKIKFISKLKTVNLNEDSIKISKEKNLTVENEKNNTQTQELNNTIKINKVNINSDPKLNITENKNNIKDKDIIDEFLLNKSAVRKNKRGKDKELDKFKLENNKTEANGIVIYLNEKNKGSKLYNKKNKYNYIKCVKTMKNNNNKSINNKESNNSMPKKKYEFEISRKLKNKQKKIKYDKTKEIGKKSKNILSKKFI